MCRQPVDEVAQESSLLHYTHQAHVISIYVQFETLDTETRVNEALITEVFEPFGHMTGCFIKNNNTSASGLRQHGYAFVHFNNSYEGKKSALAATSISKSSSYQYHNVLFHAEVSKNFKKATSTSHHFQTNHNYRDSATYGTPPYQENFGNEDIHNKNDIDHINPHNQPYSRFMGRNRPPQVPLYIPNSQNNTPQNNSHQGYYYPPQDYLPYPMMVPMYQNMYQPDSGDYNGEYDTVYYPYMSNPNQNNMEIGHLPHNTGMGNTIPMNQDPMTGMYIINVNYVENSCIYCH